ncbi:MAG: hypothetical protein K8T26_08395 [Lentisphaerae bacterium]|nr:hypothetical protein [Lentisphaerota bacterium]
MSTSLDERLRRWRRMHLATDTHLATLAQIISEDLRRHAQAEDRRPAAADTVGFGIKLAYAAAGAMVMAAALVLWPERAGGPAHALPVPALATLDGGRLAAHSQVFREMQHLFADQLRWVSETDRQIDFGVAPAAGETAAVSAGDARPVCVRFTAVVRQPATDAWVPVWYQDVVLRCEDRISVRSGVDDGGTLGLWVYRLDDGRLAVETDLDVVAPVALRAHVDTVMDLGTPAQVLSMREGDTEYRVYQTVQPLPPARPVDATGRRTS